MDNDHADQAAGIIQRRVRGHQRRQRYAANLARLMTIEVEAKSSEFIRLQQWYPISSVPSHPAVRPELRSVLHKFAHCVRDRAGTLLHYRFPASIPNLNCVLGHELRRCRRLKDVSDVVQIRDEVVQIDDQIVISLEIGNRSRPLLDYIASLGPGIYNENFIRNIIASLVTIIGALHERDVFCGHLLPSKLYHDGVGLKLMAFGLGKYMPIADQIFFIPDVDGFMAPEILHGDGAYRLWSDAYSIGAFLYLLLTGMQFIGDIPMSPVISNDARDLLTTLLQRERYHRPSLSQILQHQWFHVDLDHSPSAKWSTIQLHLCEIRDQRALYDRILRRYAIGANRRPLTLRFFRLLDYETYPGFGEASSFDQLEISEALKVSLEHFIAQYLSKDEVQRSQMNPFEFIGRVLKDVASKKKLSGSRTRPGLSKLELALVRSEEGAVHDVPILGVSVDPQSDITHSVMDENAQYSNEYVDLGFN